MKKHIEIEPQPIEFEQAVEVLIRNKSHQSLYRIGIEMTSNDLDVFTDLEISIPNLDTQQDVQIGNSIFNTGSIMAFVKYDDDDTKAAIQYIYRVKPQSVYKIMVQRKSDEDNLVRIHLETVMIESKRANLIHFLPNGNPALAFAVHRGCQLHKISIPARPA